MMFVRSLLALTGVILQPVFGAECDGPAELKRAIQGTPSAAAHGALGAWFAQNQRPGCAVLEFKKAAELEPNSFESRYNLGLALIQTGERRGATAEFRKAVALKPDSV